MPPSKKQNAKKSLKIKAKQTSRKKKSNGADHIPLTECAARYAIAIADPWDRRAEGVCVPRAPSRPSQKTTTFQRFTAYVGTHGTGFCAVAPCLANNLGNCWYTNASFGGNTIVANPGSLAPGVQQTSMSNLPYTLDQLTNESPTNTLDVKGRIVACSVSVKYVGTEVTRGGQVYCHVSDDHTNVEGMSPADLGALRSTDISTPGADRQKCWVSIYGVDDHETSYPESSDNTLAPEYQRIMTYPLSNGALGQSATQVYYGAAPIAIMFQGSAGNAYEINIVQHSEYIGDLATTHVTANMVDDTGFGLVQTAAQNMAAAKASDPRKPWSKIMLQELRQAVRQHGPAAIKAGGALLAAAL